MLYGPGSFLFPIFIGIAWTDNPAEPRPWTRLPEPVLTRDQPDCRYWEKLTQYKSNVIWDKEKRLGSPFVMFYNAKTKETPWIEQTGLATSTDLKFWTRHKDNPVIPLASRGFTSALPKSPSRALFISSRLGKRKGSSMIWREGWITWTLEVGMASISSAPA